MISVTIETKDSALVIDVNKRKSIVPAFTCLTGFAIALEAVYILYLIW